MIGVTKHVKQRKDFPQGLIVYEIDTGKAVYRNTLIRDLGTVQRRKFENLVFIDGARERLPMRFIYH